MLVDSRMCPRCVPVELPVLPDSESKRFFREVFGRSVNVLNDRYILPADDDEVKVSIRVILVL